MSIKREDLQKLELDLIEFLYSENSKLLDSTLVSIRENYNKCFYLFGINLAIFSYGVNKINISNIQIIDIPYIIMLIGALISSCILILMPQRLKFPGARASKIIEFHILDENLPIKEAKITTILSYEKSISENFLKINKITNSYSVSSKLLLGFFIVSSFSLFICAK